MRIASVDAKFDCGSAKEDVIDVVNVEFERVSEKQIQWNDLFPEWIDEGNSAQRCPVVPVPEDLGTKYTGIDVVVAEAPCGVNKRDVYRLQVNLIVANLAVTNRNGPVYVVFVGKCGPMIEVFRCDDLLWAQEDVRIYKPNPNKLKQKLAMPVGSCQIAHPLVEQGEEEKWRPKRKREAYVSVLHSSDTYVCGAIALAQSLKQTNTTKDLLLLVDSSVSQVSLRALRLAGWDNIKTIQRVKNPHAKKDSYNEWNYSKLRIWSQQVASEYDKVMFVDSDVLPLRNMDAFFTYPELSAAANDNHLFNSGVVVLEPSACTFRTLMEARAHVVPYNGGDQGFLNEVFIWWHRFPASANRLKIFASGRNHRHLLPEDVHAVHYLGQKPWACYRDYDCNWDRSEYQKFASDSAHERWWRVYDDMPAGLKEFCALSAKDEARLQKWRGRAENASFPDGHWKLKITDPRSHSFIN
ncbi:unnamed protein product [Cuscuta campestris]|uniref:Hexosyltransferase n=1 Tax=Cuscuta campestris TaxID=132261 RepID=A0A484L303_9ASTE|nr:unnamed protein product [Cuscuta campestris]